MPATATADRKQEVIPGIHPEDSDNGSDKPTRRGNPLMKSLAPDMIKDPHELDFADGMMSDEFAWEKTCKYILEPLEFKTEKEWLDFAKKVWLWRQDLENRQNAAIADKLLAEAASNPQVLEILKQKLAS